MKMEAHEKEKRVKKLIVYMVISLVLGLLLALILIPYIRPDKPAIYESVCSIDPQGYKNTSAKWEYDIQPEKKWFFSDTKESWAFFDMDLKDIKDDFNLSDCKGISFYIRGSTNTNIVEFSLFTHEFYNGMHEIYQYWNEEKLLVDNFWKPETIHFSNLTLTPWTKKYYPGAPNEPDLKKVYGIGFAVRTNEAHIQNAIFIDELELIYKNGSRITISDFSTFNVDINGKEGYWHCWRGHH
jgi:hypothetical protein